jgi:hypothetical protein
MPIQLDSASGAIILTAEDGSGNASVQIPRAGFPDHSSFLSNSDIGVNVEAFDGTILKDADIGVTVLAPNGDGSNLTNLPVADMGGTMTAHIIPDTDDAYDIGSSTKVVRDLFLGANSLHIGSLTISESSGKLVLPLCMMTAHIIPDTDNTYDIGSAEFKIRDAYISENSLWIGDNHKDTASGGKKKTKKRKQGKTPKKIVDALVGEGKLFDSLTELKNKFKIDIHNPAPDPVLDPEHPDFHPPIHRWLEFSAINGQGGFLKPSDIFDDDDDFEEEPNTENVYILDPSVSTIIDPVNGGIQSITLIAPTVFTEVLTAGQSVVLMISGAAANALTFPTITWVTSAGNVAPTLTDSATVVIWKVGSTLYGAYVGSFV